MRGTHRYSDNHIEQLRAVSEYQKNVCNSFSGTLSSINIFILSTSPYKNQTEGDTSRFSDIDDITHISSSCPQYDLCKIEIRHLNGD